MTRLEELKARLDKLAIAEAAYLVDAGWVQEDPDHLTTDLWTAPKSAGYHHSYPGEEFRDPHPKYIRTSRGHAVNAQKQRDYNEYIRQTSLGRVVAVDDELIRDGRKVGE